jgi:formylglycine-generating enzyme required for sulfatase activity
LKRIAFLFCFISYGPLVYPQSGSFNSYDQNIPGSALTFKMLPIPAGKVFMGSSENEPDRSKDEGPQKNIQIAAFWMSAYEVTRDEFDVFFKDESTSMNTDVDAITRPSPQYIDLSWGMGKEGGYPVNSMSQYAAIMYCRWLYQKTGVFYRLPTEAEWEYACKAGSTDRYYFGNDAAQLGDYAWYEKNSDNKFHKVGEKKANAWGLYDMLGNLMEWTMDHYEESGYQRMSDKDPMVAYNPLKYPKVLRGGAFNSAATELRTAKRFHSDPQWNQRDPQIPRSKWWLTDASNVGIRLLRPLNQPAKEDIDAFYTKYLGR